MDASDSEKYSVNSSNIWLIAELSILIFIGTYLLFPLQVMSQISITGRVTEASVNLPVLYATVYVNGTSNGTITDLSGQFSLDKVTPPCEIVISHISHDTEVIELKHNTDTTLEIRLKPKEVKLETVDVVSKNRREENLRHFRERFLGTDYWGKHAYFENDSVLIFNQLSTTKRVKQEHQSILLPADSSSTLFTATTKGPLLVNLPLLGYKLHINLIHYTEVQTGNDKKYRFHSLGYFYFQSEEDASKRKTNRFKKQRLKAYYHSDRHFCRSLFTDRLKENGYIVFSSVLNPATKWYDFKELEFDKHRIHSTDEVKVVGLKNKSFFIRYYERKTYPANLNEIKNGQTLSSELSKIYFLKDTCTIRSDGSRPDNSIMFGSKIGDKRVGAMLPNDYEPEKEE